MEEVTPDIQPMPYKHRRYTFRILVALFLGVIPFLYLYATGYRFEFGTENTIVSTGGLYVAAEKTDASIYVDDVLVRETRTFRRAFYAQNLDPGTHRVHVQKDGYHTWVKELPVYPHIVTEAQAFMLPLVPQIRTVSPWKNNLGASVLFSSSTLRASTTNEIYIATTTATTTLTIDTEFVLLSQLFLTLPATTTDTFGERVTSQFGAIFNATTTATSTEEIATTTKEWQDVRLSESNGDVIATWIGSREQMPYYYCAEEFELLGTSTLPFLSSQEVVQKATVAEFVHPVQTISEDAICEPVINIDRLSQKVTSFDFLPGSIDFVILTLEDGVYVVEVDNRGWQNVQPLLLGTGLDMRIENGNVYVYDGTLIYQVLIDN